MFSVNVEQKELDPEFHNESSHTEFRLNDLNVTYLSSMRLANVCAHGTGVSSSYNNACGVKALIKNITLFDGSVVLAQLNNSAPYLAFKGINRNNSDQREKRKVNLDTVAMMNYSVGGSQRQNQISIASSQVIGGANSTEATSQKGYIDLTEVLHELRSLRYLPTSLFKNLRLYIQWNTDPAIVLAEAKTATVVKIGTPILVVDTIFDAKTQSQLLSSIRNVAMVGIENERVSIPKIETTDSPKTTDLVLKGYDNKTVRRMLFINSPTDEKEGVYETTDQGVKATNNPLLCNGRLNSLAQRDMILQLNINGSALFNGQGLTGHNRRAGVLADTFGDVILTQYGNSTGVYGLEDNNGATRDRKEFSFGRDYTGFSVNASIRTLQLSYTRKALENGTVAICRPQALNQALNLNIYGEVLKSFSINGGSYDIAYV